MLIGTSSLSSAVVSRGGSLFESKLTVIVIVFEDMMVYSVDSFSSTDVLSFYSSFRMMFSMLMR